MIHSVVGAPSGESRSGMSLMRSNICPQRSRLPPDWDQTMVPGRPDLQRTRNSAPRNSVLICALFERES